MIRIHIFVFLILVCQAFVNAQQNDSIAISTFSLEPGKDGTTVTIEYLMKGSGVPLQVKTNPNAKNIFEEFFGAQDRDPNILSSSQVSDRIENIVYLNPEIKYVRTYPVYMEQIFGMIKGAKKREKARLIYASNNTQKLVSHSSSNSIQYIDKVLDKSSTFRYSFTVKVRKELALIIPALYIVNQGEIFRTQELIIPLK